MNLINEVDKPIVKKTVVVYAGRFQPFHRGHYAAYKKLVDKFGKDSVYVGTSNDTDNSKSPFNFKEKKQIATTMFDIAPNHFIQIRNPYKPVEILKGFDGKTTQYIAAVGDKDATRLQGKYFKPYQGKAGYGFDEIGYVYAVPAESNPISGTDVRKGLGGTDMDLSKKFFLHAYPKFNQTIFDLITHKISSLNEAGALSGAGQAGSYGPMVTKSPADDEEKITEDGFPGGVGVGLVLPGGSINGAPKPKDVAKLSKKIHKDKDSTDSDYVYDPISEIILQAISEEMFNEFTENYFNEAPNPELDKDITYTNTKGKSQKIKARDALHLPKDHPAHIQAAKIVGDIEPTSPKQPAANLFTKKKPVAPPQSGQPVQKGQTAQGKIDNKPQDSNPTTNGSTEPAEHPQKISGAEFKTDAEKSTHDTKSDKAKVELDTELNKLPESDRKAIKNTNDPKSAERQAMTKNTDGFLKRLGNGIADSAKKWWDEKKHIGKNIGNAIKALANGKKIGSIKHEITNKETGEKETKWVHHSDFKKKKEVVDKKTGKKRIQLVPKGSLSGEERAVMKKSEDAHRNQVHSMKHAAKDLGMIAAGIATAGAASGVIAGQGAVAGIGAIAHHGLAGVGLHIAKDLGKHSALEAMGMKGHHAAGTSTALAVATGGLLEDIEENDVTGEKFINELIKKTLERMKEYQMSDEELLQSIKSYNKQKGEGDVDHLSNVINEGISKSKVKNIADFVKYSTEKLKLKTKPKIKLIFGSTYSNEKASLGGYSPETKDIVVVVDGRMTADICRTIGHELVHRKQDELGLIKNEVEDGKTGSPIENQANALSGVLLRNYGKINKEIYSENKTSINEVSALSTDGDDQPNGAWLPKGSRRTLGANDGVNKTDDWFLNGGYIQLDYPEADKILGDDDENQITVRYVTKNLPRNNGPQTQFNKGEDKVKDVTQDKVKKTISEMGRNDIHFKNVFQHYRDGDAKMKQKIADVVTGNKFAKVIEIVKDLREMDHDEIEEVEDLIGISLYETIKKVGSKFIVYPKKGGKRLGTHDSMVSAKKQLAAIEINKEDISVDVNPGDTVLMGKFKNKKVKIKDIGKDPHGMPTINGKQATTFRKGTNSNIFEEMLDDYITNIITEGNFMVGTMQDDQSFRSPYADKWEKFDKRGKAHADIVGFTVHSHTSDHYPQKKKGVILPSQNPTEENGPGKRWMHPSKGAEYAEDKKIKWEMYPFNSRPAAYNPPPDIGTQVDIFKYTKPSVIKENINESKLLLEGGAYGHMSHPFDDMELTFGQLKDIISKALDGDLGVVREKTDGQALAISWKNGRLIAARNKGHLQNAGANAMGIEDVASKFAGRGGLTDAYNFAMNDLSAAISGLSKSQKEKIFNEGKCFMNIEVIWPTSVNVIPYGQALLVFHNTTCYDESGVAIGADQSAARTLAGMIKQVNADVQSKYTIQGPPITSIPKNQNLSSLKGSYLSKLSKLQSEFGLANNDTVSLYHQSWWENFVTKNAPVKVDKLTLDAIVKRWAFGDKSFKLTTISNPELQKWAIQNDKVNVIKQQKENVKPFEEIFLGVGADVLSFVSSVLTVHPDKAIRNMKDRLKDTAVKVKTAGSIAQIQKLKMELERLSKLGGIEKIVASEGLVFFYNGKTYKLTGTFAPLNQILGIFYE